MKLSMWAKQNSYTYQGAWMLYKRGGLPNAKQLPSGTIVVEEPKGKKPPCWAVYARVSSAEQRKTNLEYQAERLENLCKKHGKPLGYIVKEVGSGLNDQRPKLLALLRKKDITHIVVEHKDRLARFGVTYIEELCEARGIKIVIVNKVEGEKEDLLQDFVSVITSFCARLYGQRRTKRSTEKLIKSLKHEN